MKYFPFKKPQEGALFPRLVACFVVLCLLPLLGCQKSVEYFDYVSELRSNIFLAQTETLSLRIFAVKKETPYLADGIPQESSPRFEAYLVAPSGDKTVNLTFSVGGKDYGGEMSFDNVKREYFYFCTLDISAEKEISCALSYDGEEVAMRAVSVLTANALSPKTALSGVVKENQALFEGMTDKYGFAGEIYLRLIYEDSPYYYIGVIDREGKMNAFLLNAESGKILAKREG